MRPQPTLRLARSAAFAAVGVSLAALAHSAAGGPWPALPVFCAGFAGLMTLGGALSGRERSPVVVNAALVAGQLALHTAFSVTAPVPPGAIDALAGPDHGLGQSTGMLLAHLAATVMTGWWLARGEAALFALLRRLGRRLRLATALPVFRVRHAAAHFYLLFPPLSPAVEHTVSRRGPPLAA
ncbi:MFS transporter [Nonomuraea sp. NBC_01738]|uniref:MFS transporter n=1 Tax=Nonomuraea sp. NBC_01738 TaxID=2976003 RepID=UPI002E10C264|nr:MFS transporter [Nonomuraea sp. NBC_01738]